MNEMDVRLPQPFGLALESMRSRGYSEAEVLELIRRADPAELAHLIDAERDWSLFLAYAGENGDLLKAAMESGYRFSFLTMPGLQRLLAVKYRQAKDRDYEYQEAGVIRRLFMPIEDYRELRRMVPPHWDMIPEESGEDRVEITVRLSGGTKE